MEKDFHSLIKKVKMDMLLGEFIVLHKEISVMVKKAIASASNVLIVGESGVGKEYIARLIHNKRNNGHGEFKVCSLIDDVNFLKVEHLLRDNRSPSLQKTLFFKRIDCLNWRSQKHLLELVEQNMIGNRAFDRTNDVNFICSSESFSKTESETYWKDLLYRLDVIRIDIPPLRERREDIPILIDQFLQNFSLRYCKSISRVPDRLWRQMLSYSWPGNVRELKNVVERFVLLAPGDGNEGETAGFVSEGYDRSVAGWAVPLL